VTEPGHEAEADDERDRNPGQGDERRLHARSQQLVQVRFQPHLEQEDHDSELGQGVHHVRLAHEPEDAGADEHAGQQLAEHRGLADPLHPLGRELPGEPDDDERDQQLTDFHQRIRA
jgi:hypothetical protein